MRWLKFGTIIALFLLAVYAISMLFIDESKNFTIQKEINYPIERVFPQFNNLQNFTQWNEFFVSKKDYTFAYYTPYSGQGSSVHYKNLKNNSDFGDVFIRYQNPNSTLKYQLFDGKKNNPYRIDIKFIPQKNSTKIIWFVHTPKQPLLKRFLNLVSEDYIAGTIDKSVTNLKNLLGGKVEKEALLSKIKYDSLMVEEEKGELLLGINVTTSNKKGFLQKSIVMNHNRLVNFVTKDLGKKEDEFGIPVMISEPNSFKDKEVSYFYGVSLSKRIGTTDNNFNFKTLNPSKKYVIYYKGNYANRNRAIGILLNKAKKDTMRNGELQESFIESPENDKEVNLKISLPVYR